MEPAAAPTEMHPQRWGDPAREAALSADTRALVDVYFGTDERPAVADPAPPACGLSTEILDALRAAVGAEHVHTDDDTRRHRTRGKSTPDLLRARGGDLADAPDAVVRPGEHDAVATVLAVAVDHHLAVVSFGGGTSVVGGLVARREGYAGVVSLDLVRMRRLLALDPVSMTATLEPGLRGPGAEALLAEHGMVLGHYPQSFEYASLGGFAATRSSGQSSAGYGRFDQMVVGLTVATPVGRLDLGAAPTDAAGPDLRQLVLGSEGAYGVITAVRVRVRHRPERTAYEGWRWPDFATGREVIRALAQAGELPTVLRLSDEAETAINLASPDQVGTAGGDGSGDPAGDAGGCLMIVGYEGTDAAVQRQRATVTERLREQGGEPLGAGPGEQWVSGRFDAPYLRDALLDLGVLVETLETATFWSGAGELYDAVSSALTAELGEGALVLCHVSHVYETGCSLYFTVAVRAEEDPIGQWAAAKQAASDAIRQCGATITHHHAVGRDHRSWHAEQVGDVGMRMLRAVKHEVDPTGILNPGVLVE